MLTQPKSKLPFKQILSKNKRNYQIVDAKDKLVIKDVADLADALFIQDACNKITTAEKILKGVIHHNDGLKEAHKLSPSLIDQIANYLNGD